MKSKWYYNRKKVKPNKFEQFIYNLLSTANITFEREYQIPTTLKYYDAYIPSINTLLEFDGSYYHKKNILECVNKMQIKNFYNDIKKTNLASIHGYKLVRLREDDKKSYITNIYSYITNNI